ncbi:MAG: MotA/TolQ/ExbB proton channel family protein [Deltaproteobacteria bacterium]|nr:MotA/TolQ/ExbB proton channel family protein [Deltaproteobacteria bacterium]
MESIVHAFQEGGGWMYAILVVNIIVIGIAVERTIWLFFQAGMNRKDVMRRIEKHVRDGELDRAKGLVAKHKAPLAKVIAAGLGTQGQGQDAAMMLMNEASLMEIPKIEARVGYLVMFSNISTLLGLLGTIVGLIRSFSAVASASASEKATELARGISEAMNCTAFGLIVAISALLMYAWLQNRAHSLVDDVRMASTSLRNVISEVKW